MPNAHLAAALRAYARYAGVVADQLDALGRGDAARQWVLSHEREAAERELAALAAQGGVEIDGVLAAALGAVGGAAEEAGLARGRLAQLGDDARRAAHLVPPLGGGAAAGLRDAAEYLGWEAPRVDAGAHTLDVRR